MLHGEKSPVETLLYMRDDVSAFTVCVRLREDKPRSLSVNSYAFISRAEGIVSPNGMRGIVFTVEKKGEVFIMENGFLDSRMMLLDMQSQNTRKRDPLSFFRRH